MARWVARALFLTPLLERGGGGSTERSVASWTLKTLTWKNLRPECWDCFGLTAAEDPHKVALKFFGVLVSFGRKSQLQLVALVVTHHSRERSRAGRVPSTQISQDVLQRARRRRRKNVRERNIGRDCCFSRALHQGLARCSRTGPSSRSLFFRRQDSLTPFHDTVDLVQSGLTGAAFHKLFFEVKHEKFSRLN